MNQRLVSTFQNIADKVFPQHFLNGITEEDDMILYWITDKHTHNTKIITYNKNTGAFEYNGVEIR